ncbi:MAG: tetratricopeptide repeat protein [Planctomycetes bacterium]|nr:tetratricopeptide repeat protein [Planctomycetota bacterium]
MDDALARLERARAADPDDDTLAVDLARARLRAGRPLGALAVLGPRDPREREAAGEALARALGFRWLGVEAGTDRFDYGSTAPDRLNLILVHAGAFLFEGEAALASPRLEGQARALTPTVLPAFLAANVPVLRPVFPTPSDPFAERGEGRLPSAAEWTKLWRGGLFLDGDASARVPNPEPQRLRPHQEEVEATPGLGPSPYGAEVWLEIGSEALLDGHAGVFNDGGGRYLVPRPPGGGHFYRRIRDLPPDLA